MMHIENPGIFHEGCERAKTTTQFMWTKELVCVALEKDYSCRDFFDLITLYLLTSALTKPGVKSDEVPQCSLSSSKHCSRG